MSVKVFATGREKLYSAMAESQAIKERAPLTLVALVVKMANAMAEVAREKGTDLQGATPAVRAKLLQAVFDELLAGSFIKELDYCFFLEQPCKCHPGSISTAWSGSTKPTS